MNKTRQHKLSYTQIIVLGYALVILTGTLLLMLPAASRSGEWTSPLTASFTAVSSTCVTGLIVVDTFTYWTLFGQLVILTMIQIGGLGFMTVITMLYIFLKKPIGLHDRKLLMQSAGSLQLSGVVRLIKRVCIGTAIVEAAGACVLATQFIPRMGVARGIYNGVFHSVSAFCNAGFDLMGRFGSFSSLTGWSSNVTVCVTVMALITVGGLGFFAWGDILRSRFRFRHFELHTKIVVTVSAILVFGGAAFFFIVERNASMACEGVPQRILNSFFQSVTTRTAGFNTVNLASLSEPGSLMSDILMFIGGSPGSTAGGIKTTTFAVLLICVFSSSRKYSSDRVFKRRLEDGVVRQACATLVFYLCALLVSVLAITAIEPFSLRDVLFECSSAIGTVGLTVGITSQLSAASRIIVMLLMFLGRAGGISLALALAEKKSAAPVERPPEKIMIG